MSNFWKSVRELARMRRFIPKERRAGSLVRQWFKSERKRHWPDCALNHGGAECDMGPECGVDS